MISEDATRIDEVAAAMRGDEVAFRAIYEQLATRVYNLVLRSVHEPATAEDICQEVWLKAHREISSLQAPGALRTWLFRLASRSCIDYTRTRAFRERGCPENTEDMLDSPSDEPETVALRRGELRMMWETLASMPPRQSLALYLKQVDGRSYDEIGRILDCPKTAVETLLFRARQGFARAHQHLEAEPGASCKMIGQVMAVVLDHEGTPFQQRAVEVHVADCKVCRDQMQGLSKGAAGYLWLPLLPVGQGALLAALAGGAGGLSIGLPLGRLIQLLIAKAQAGATAVAVVGVVGTTGVVAGAAAGVTPPPSEIVGSVREAVASGGGAQSGSQLSEGGESAIRLPGGGDAPVGGASGLPPAGLLDTTLPTEVAAPPILPDALDSVTETVENTLQNVTALVDDTLQGLGETVAGVLQDPLGTVTGILTDPIGTVNETVETVDEVVEGTTETADQAVDDTTDAVDDLTDGSLGGVTEVLDDTIDETTDVVDDLPGPPEDEEGGGCLLSLLC